MRVRKELERRVTAAQDKASRRFGSFARRKSVTPEVLCKLVISLLAGQLV
jgi:hypothetical protein